MRLITFLSLFAVTSCASLFPPPAVVAPIPEVDQVSEIITEIGAVVSTFTIDKDISIIKDDTKEVGDRKTLSYTFKKSNKSRVIEVVIKIVPVKRKVHYTLVIQMLSHSEYNVIKKIELKTTVAEELITQARNLLSTF